MNIKANLTINVKDAQASIDKLGSTVKNTNQSIQQVTNATHESIKNITTGAKVSAEQIKSIAVFMVSQSLGTISAGIETYAGDKIKKIADYFKNAASTATSFAAALAPLGPAGITIGAAFGTATGALNTFIQKQKETKENATQLQKALENQRQRLHNAVFSIQDYDKQSAKNDEKTAWQNKYNSLSWKDQIQFSRDKAFEIKQEINKQQTQLQDAVGNKNATAAEKIAQNIIALKKEINDIKALPVKDLIPEPHTTNNIKNYSPPPPAQKINVDTMQRIGATYGNPTANTIQNLQLKEAKKTTAKLIDIQNTIRTNKGTNKWN